MVRAVGVKKADGSSLCVQSVGRPTEIARYSTFSTFGSDFHREPGTHGHIERFEPTVNRCVWYYRVGARADVYDQSPGRRVLVNCQGNLALILIAKSTSLMCSSPETEFYTAADIIDEGIQI